MVAKKQDNGVVNIHGKDYKTVAKRVDEFRNDERYKDWSIINEILINDGELVVIRSSILDKAGVTVATGFAEEKRGMSNINKTSALENCETSAVGRCLSFLGFAGAEIASADEITQEQLEQERFIGIELGIAMERHRETINAVRDGIASNDLESAVEALYELDRDELQSIWVAPSKGGPFSVHERNIMKTDEWSELRKRHFEDKQ